MSYPGGKSGAGVYQTIINLMPPHEVYIEPFLGGGAIMRLKRPAALNIGLDLEARALPPETAMLDPAAKNGDRRSTNAENGEASSRKNARFEFRQADGIAFLESFKPEGRTLIYCDPPYLMATRSGKRLYEHEMSEVDHRRLLRALQDLSPACLLMISGYSHPLYARELKTWNVASYQTTTRGGKPVAEWLWYNFPRPVELHDYRYLGSNYREREKIKRQQKRWKGRLARMNTLQRQALLFAIAETAAFDDGASGMQRK